MSVTSAIRRTDQGLVIDPSISGSEIYFPISHNHLRDLVGKVLTHVDALGLPNTQGQAAKDLIKQSLYRWFDEVQENSMTSYRGCIAPIEVLSDADGHDRKYIWHAEGNHAISV